MPILLTVGTLDKLLPVATVCFSSVRYGYSLTHSGGRPMVADERTPIGEFCLAEKSEAARSCQLSRRAQRLPCAEGRSQFAVFLLVVAGSMFGLAERLDWTPGWVFLGVYRARRRLSPSPIFAGPIPKCLSPAVSSTGATRRPRTK